MLWFSKIPVFQKNENRNMFIHSDKLLLRQDTIVWQTIWGSKYANPLPLTIIITSPLMLSFT